jgi:hypothetical protein
MDIFFLDIFTLTFGNRHRLENRYFQRCCQVKFHSLIVDSVKKPTEMMKLLHIRLIKKFVLITLAYFLIKIYVNTEGESAENVEVCGSYPSERDIFVDNMIWQVLDTSKG